MVVKKLVVEGFQSLYSVSLSLGKFTVVYGESDVGKSACYRALRAFLTSATGDSFISHGKDEVKVTFELVSGERITWRKRRGKSGEYLMGNRVWKQSRSLPSEIVSLLKFAPLEVDSTKFYVNLRGQFDNMFLLFESSARRAKLLGLLISNILLEGVRIANVKKMRVDADVRVLDDFIQSLESALSVDVKDLMSKMRALSVVLLKSSKEAEKFEELESLLNRYMQLDVLLERAIPDVPDISFDRLYQEAEKLDALDKMLSSVRSLDFQISESVRRLQNLIRERDKVKIELDTLRQQLTIKCPKCGTDILISEVWNA